MCPASSDPRPIALVGMMGAGKTTLGRALAQRLGWPFRDLDEEVEQAAGATVAQLFERQGEAGFRELEHSALARLLDGSLIVLATGGGAVLDPRSRELLRHRALTIWLDAAPATLAGRVAGNGARPLLTGGAPAARLTDLLEERRPFYSEAHQRIEAGDGGEAEVLARLMAAIRSSRP